MKEPQFTPGPWSIEKSEYPDGAGYFYIKAKSEIIGGDCLIFQGVKSSSVGCVTLMPSIGGVTKY